MRLLSGLHWHATRKGWGWVRLTWLRKSANYKSSSQMRSGKHTISRRLRLPQADSGRHTAFTKTEFSQSPLDRACWGKYMFNVMMTVVKLYGISHLARSRRKKLSNVQCNTLHNVYIEWTHCAVYACLLPTCPLKTPKSRWCWLVINPNRH